jgi:hypothetical protein
LRRFKLGRFLLDTGFYIPYYLFSVEVQNAGKTSTQLLAIDAVTGELDLYSFDSVPTETDLMEVETIQFGQTALSEKAAFALLQEKVQRSVYLQGFFQINNLSITGKIIQPCYLPYWVGLYEQKKRANVEVIDAVRGRFEGAKVRELVLDWFQREATRRQANADVESK